MVVAVVAGVVLGLTAAVLLLRVPYVARHPIWGDRSSGQPAPVEDEQAALAAIGRRSLNTLRTGIVVLDGSDQPVVVNPAARAMGLLRAGPVPGSTAAHPLIRTLAGQVRRTGVRREIELDLPRGRGSSGPDPLGVHLRAMGMGGGYIAVEATDATEAHRLARVRRDFVANVSHELKTPIGALQLLAEALLDATGPADRTEPVPVEQVEPAGVEWAETGLAADMAAARRFAERIQKESTRLGRLVQELLELTRLQGAEQQPPAEPVEVDAMIAEVLDRTRTAAAARRVEIVVEGERDLTVYGNDGQLATAVANLVDNAIAYSGEGSTVTVATAAGDDTVEIAVTDQGIGIAPADVERVFERFYRADQARSRQTGGTGLGLAIVKHVASNHGGRVEVSSTLGGGSTFTLRLPTGPPDELLPTGESESGTGWPETADQRGRSGLDRGRAGRSR